MNLSVTKILVEDYWIFRYKMFTYWYCTITVCISENVSRKLQLCVSELSAMYLGIIPLLMSNYTDILLKYILLLIMEF